MRTILGNVGPLNYTKIFSAHANVLLNGKVYQKNNELIYNNLGM
ncbi:hypothetical protein [Candidatus Neptunichlamydia sp. REUL1]|nr:hypothetical protein [Candidatus Neptunochlamydia sp. REUL1]